MNPNRRILVHTCCACCATEVIKRLKHRFMEIELFFYNPNIYPESEYIRRRDEVKKIAAVCKVFFSEMKPDHKLFLEEIKGHDKDKEGGERCKICYKLRLRTTAQVADQDDFGWFTTTLTISPHKNSSEIIKLGIAAGGECNVEFFDEDFKKKDGFKKSIEHSKEHHLYRQDYCGCEFSMRR